MTYREEQPVPNPCDKPKPKPPKVADRDDIRRNIERANDDG